MLLRLQEIDCLFCAIQQCYKQFTGKENLRLPGTQSINDKYEMEHEKIKVAHLQIYTIMEYSRSGSGERDRKRSENDLTLKYCSNKSYFKRLDIGKII